MFGFVNVSLIRCRWFKFVALLGPEPAMFPAGLVISSLLLLQGMWCPTIKWLNVRDEQAYCYWKPIQSIPGAVLSECKKCFCYPRFFAWRLLGEVSLFSTWSNRTRGLLQVSKSSRTRSWSERKENGQLRTVTEILFGQARKLRLSHSKVHAIWMVFGPSKVRFVETSKLLEFHWC